MSSLVCRTFVCLSLVFSAIFIQAQTPAVQKNRITVHPDLSARTRLQGYVPQWADPARDQGETAASLPLHLTFVLSRSPEIEASFTQLLADQQDPNSARYHQWLTPQQIGEQFGPTQSDVDSVTSWLTSEGFTGVEVSPSRIFVTAAATASGAAAALGTSFHNFGESGRPRISTTGDPSIPTAFTAVVGSIYGLSDAGIRPMVHAEAMAAGTQTGVHPQYTAPTGAHYVTPNDFSTIFDLKAVYNTGFTGTGQKIAIVGRSRVAQTDITAFEAHTGLSPNNPVHVVPPSGVDPGITGDDDQGEATLDFERAVGTAPGAQIDLVISRSTGAADGIYIAAQYEVQTLLDPVMNISFGTCELYSGPGEVKIWDTLFAQAAGEGISVFVSSADSGAAGCDEQFTTPPNYQFRSINAMCASSYVTCVGGTQLADTTNPSKYWSTTNDSGLGSALGYIPEGGWNEQFLNGQLVAAAGGGGASIYVAKPSWQTGTGVPADGARDVPDVSFPSASHDGYYGCFANGGGDCSNNRFESFFGTSTASPAMAAITAILNEKLGGSQGNLNPLLYRVAGSSSNGFHDATPASSGTINCSISVPSTCNNSISMPMNSSVSGLEGYALTTGYDLVTGLGSMDVANFITAASAASVVKLAATTLVVTGSASTISDTDTATFTAMLTSKTAGSPTGTVQFYANGKALGSAVPVVSGTATTAAIPFPAAGAYYITASYSGDSTYGATISTGFPLTVTGLASVTKVTISNPSIYVGTSASFNVSVSAGSGTTVPTGFVRFLVYSSNGNIYGVQVVPLSGGSAVSSALSFSTTGGYTVTAYYLGDSVYSPSTSATQPITVQRLVSQIIFNGQPVSIGIGGGASYNASVFATVSSTAPRATGTFQLYANGTPLGTPVAVGGGTTVFPDQIFSTAGSYTITTSYSGDTYYQPATTSNSMSLTVATTLASYQISVNNSAATVTAGGVITNSVWVAGILGFTGKVNLACSVTYNGTGTPSSPPSCSLSGGSASLSPASSLQSVTLTTFTTAASTKIADGGTGQRDWQMGGYALCGLMICLWPLRRRSWRTAGMWTLLAVAFGVSAGCSGGGSSPGSTTPTPTVTPGTTAGSYTETITASSTVVGAATPAPVTIALTVQ